jgi:hypothetical protein
MSPKEQGFLDTGHAFKTVGPGNLGSLEELFAAVELEQEQAKSSRTPKPEILVRQNIRSTPNRHLLTLPEGSKIPVAYGCTDCYWRYDPNGVSELYEAATLLSAQVFFRMHDCHKFRMPKS